MSLTTNLPSVSTAVDQPEDIPCKCKSACTQKKSEKRKGCPCKTNGVLCTSDCRCGAKCKNKAVAATSGSTDGNRAPLPSANENGRESEEVERKKENKAVKDFINTLDEQLAKTLAIRALQRGIGSMEFIESLLMEDEGDETGDGSLPGTSSHANSSTEETGTSKTPVATTSANAGVRPEWCKCGNCRSMPREIKNKCCGSRTCVTEQRRFPKLCLDADVLQLCIMNRADIRNDPDDNSTRSFRKAAYRQFILDRHGYLGKGNRKVAPSCVVLRVRHQYPSPTGVYMGFREK